MYNGFHTANELIFITCKELDITGGLSELSNQVKLVDEKWKKLNNDACSRMQVCTETLELLEELDKKLLPIEQSICELGEYVNKLHLFGDNINQADFLQEEIEVCLFILFYIIIVFCFET